MKNRSRKQYTYEFKTTEEIESCYNCPAGEQYLDKGYIECRILKMSFTLEKDQDFPDNCPMEETNLPEGMNRQ